MFRLSSLLHVEDLSIEHGEYMYRTCSNYRYFSMNHSIELNFAEHLRRDEMALCMKSAEVGSQKIGGLDDGC